MVRVIQDIIDDKQKEDSKEKDDDKDKEDNIDTDDDDNMDAARAVGEALFDAVHGDKDDDDNEKDADQAPSDDGK